MVGHSRESLPLGLGNTLGLGLQESLVSKQPTHTEGVEEEIRNKGPVIETPN